MGRRFPKCNKIELRQFNAVIINPQFMPCLAKMKTNPNQAGITAQSVLAGGATQVKTKTKGNPHYNFKTKTQKLLLLV